MFTRKNTNLKKIGTTTKFSLYFSNRIFNSCDLNDVNISPQEIKVTQNLQHILLTGLLLHFSETHKTGHLPAAFSISFTCHLNLLKQQFINYKIRRSTTLDKGLCAQCHASNSN